MATEKIFIGVGEEVIELIGADKEAFIAEKLGYKGDII